MKGTETLTTGKLQFEGINDFNYLGANVNSENKADEIIKRIIAENHAYFSQRKLLRSHLLSKGTNMAIHKMLTRPVLTYGAETCRQTSLGNL
jgi:hypothetical protein